MQWAFGTTVGLLALGCMAVLVWCVLRVAHEYGTIPANLTAAGLLPVPLIMVVSLRWLRSLRLFAGTVLTISGRC